MPELMPAHMLNVKNAKDTVRSSHANVTLSIKPNQTYQEKLQEFPRNAEWTIFLQVSFAVHHLFPSQIFNISRLKLRVKSLPTLLMLQSGSSEDRGSIPKSRRRAKNGTLYKLDWFRVTFSGNGAENWEKLRLTDPEKYFHVMYFYKQCHVGDFY